MGNQRVDHVHRCTPGAGGVGAKIERGQRGGYAWELSVEMAAREGEDHRATFQRAIDALLSADYTMCALFELPPRDDGPAA